MKRFRIFATTSCLTLLGAWLAPASLLAQNPTAATEADRDKAVATLASDSPLYDRAMACRTLTIVGDEASVDALAAQLGSVELGAYARLALESIPGSAASDALLASLDQVEESAKIGVIGSLGRRREVRAVAALTQIAQSDSGAAAAALAALGAIADDAALKSLTQLRTTGIAQVDELCAAILLACDRNQSNDSNSLALQALESIVSPPQGSAAAAPRFIEMAHYQAIRRGANDSQQRLSTLLASESESAFRLGIQASRELKSDSIDALLSTYPASESARKIAILFALSSTADERALPILIEAANGDDVEVRLAALETLGDWTQASSIDTLLAALADADAQVVAVATESLSRLGDDSVDRAILKHLASENESLVVASIALIGSRGITSAQEELFELLNHRSPAIAQASMTALGAVVDQQHYEKLVARLITATDEQRPIVQASLIAAANRLDRNACVLQLADQIQTAPEAVLVSAIEIAGAVEGEAALQLIDLMGRTNKDSLTDAATRVLGRWSNPDAADVLVRFAKDLDQERYRVRAIRSLLRLARQFEMPLGRRMELVAVASRQANRAEELTLIFEILTRYPAPQGLTLSHELAVKGDREQALAAAMSIATALAPQGDEASLAAIEQFATAVAGSPAEAQVASLLQEAQRQVRARSAEPGFASLFDGSSLDRWAGDRKIWRAEQGAIVGGSLEQAVGTGNDFLCFDQEYENFELRLQFRLEGDGVNGGVNVRSRRGDDGTAIGYQADLGAGFFGAIYDEARRNRVIAPAQVNAILNDQWNDYWIRCEGPRIRVWLNGTLTTDFTETEEMPRRGLIALQVQAGRPVKASYRQIRVRELSDEELQVASEERVPEESEFKPLFDGNSFEGWHGNLDWFRIQDSVIIAGTLDKPIPRNEFLRTDREYGDFELRLQFQLKGSASANAGVQIRTAEIPDHHEVSGYQADMGNGWWGCLYDESRRNRVLAGPAPEDRGKMLNADDWNDYRIRCEGSRVRLWINGVLTVDYTESDPEIARSGIIAVQVHSGDPTEAWYRNIRILELNP